MASERKKLKLPQI